MIAPPREGPRGYFAELRAAAPARRATGCLREPRTPLHAAAQGSGASCQWPIVHPSRSLDGRSPCRAVPRNRRSEISSCSGPGYSSVRSPSAHAKFQLRPEGKNRSQAGEHSAMTHLTPKRGERPGARKPFRRVARADHQALVRRAGCEGQRPELHPIAGCNRLTRVGQKVPRISVARAEGVCDPQRLDCAKQADH